MNEVNIAKVAVENTAYHFDMEYDYRIPDSLLSAAKPGCRVTVSFGNTAKKRQGMIFDVVKENTDKKLKPVIEVIDDKPVLNEEMLHLVRWMSERTFCTLFEAVKAVLPNGMNNKVIVSYAASDSDTVGDLSSLTADEKAVYDLLCEKAVFLREDKILSQTGLTKNSSVPESLVRKGFAVRNYDAVRNVSDLSIRKIRLSDDYLSGAIESVKLTKKQQEVVDVLTDAGTATIKELCYFTGFTSSVPMSLVTKGVAEVYETEAYRNPYSVETDGKITPINLSDEQQKAYESLYGLYRSGKGSASLLFGVTGSGKTKVYMKMIDAVLSDSKGVILMVPEISLTPQTLKLFHTRYGKRVAVFHSALSVGERLDEWKRVKNGEALVVVGTRSAVFAPFDNIGMIVVDEEQEGAYKSESTPRYSTKDVARFRCARHGALLVLASATPSIDTFAAAKSGRYVLNTLTKRYGDALLPEVVTVDMCEEYKNGNDTQISSELLSELRTAIENGRQAILLMNRRGYNTFASCASCGHVVTCPSCSISMTYHKANGRLMCHYCGYSVPFSADCPSCSQPTVRYSGFGTQKIEDTLAELLPEARVLRMDTDTTMSRFAHEEKLKKFANREYDILLGTQMVAKGLDFENVTLVGVISVDSLLYNDDFRSLERTFSLLTQVVGRSGRGRFSGKALIQTSAPQNEIISMASRQDYIEFYESEIEVRRLLIYPPYCDLCVIAFISQEELFAKGAAKKFLEKLSNISERKEYSQEKLIVLGPSPAKISRMNGKFRYRLIIKCKNSVRFRKMLSELLRETGKDKMFSMVTTVADINPESIL